MKPPSPFLSDPTLVLLLASTFIFTGMMIFVAFRLPDHVPLFTVLQGLTTGFGGAVLGRVKPQTKEQENPQGRVTETTIAKVETPAPEPPPVK
jgi:hypothetical protein